jgi:hypothetical protein
MKSRHLFALTDAERRLLLRKLEPSSMDTKTESRLARELRERLYGCTPEVTEGEIERVRYCAGELLAGEPSAVVQHLGKHGETTVRVALDKLARLFRDPSRPHGERPNTRTEPLPSFNPVTMKHEPKR